MPIRAGWLTIEGRRTRYHEAGTGPPVVVVHGLGLSGEFWTGHFSAFTAAGFRIVAPDLPAFGDSEGPLLGQTVEETAAWLLAFADALGLGTMAWVGHSIAAQAALEAAVRAPHRARALVLATPTGAPGRWRALRQAFGFLRDIGRERLSLVPAVAREYLRGSLVAYFASWLKAARDRPAEKAERVPCPTLIVVGREDPVVPWSYIDLLRERIPDARVIMVPGGAHGLVFDREGEFDRIATAFLREHLG